MVKSSLELGVVPSPLLSLCKQGFMNILLNLNEVFALCLRELGSLVDVDVLFSCLANHYSWRGWLTDLHSSV
jgi:hypothetical protein